MAGTGDPVAAGLVASLARPGGNVTGLSSIGPELNSKRLELLKETVPRASRIGVLFNGANPSNVAAMKEMETVAPALGVELERLDTRGGASLDAALAHVRARHDGLRSDEWFETPKPGLVAAARRAAGWIATVDADVAGEQP